MHWFSAGPANSHYTSRIHPTRIHPVLTSFADEIRGTLARLFAYVMVLALIAIGGISAWDQLPDAIAMAPAVKESWSLAARSSPAFAVSQFNLLEKTELYEIFRHPIGAAASAATAPSADWLTSADNPRLRGAL